MIAGQKWYKSTCTSNVEPKIHQDLDTLCLPVNVAYDEETQMYRYEEYRMLLPIDYEVPERVATELAFATERGAVKADNLTKENLTMANAGIMRVKAYCSATSNPPMADSGVFASGVEEWKPDTEYKLNDLFSYDGNMGYVKQPTLTSQELYPPFSVGTEALYGARPKPDTDGIYPYVYNMGIYEGMLVRDDDGFVYRSITGTQERPTELLYHPKDVPALLVKVEEEVPEIPDVPEEGEEEGSGTGGGAEVPSEEYPEWVQPTGAHDAYAQGAKVSHNGKKWTSDIPANVYEPGVFGWIEVKE